MSDSLDDAAVPFCASLHPWRKPARRRIDLFEHRDEGGDGDQDGQRGKDVSHALL
jgi:hypothetical protein